jgi:hypothetical protein
LCDFASTTDILFSVDDRSAGRTDRIGISPQIDA